MLGQAHWVGWILTLSAPCLPASDAGLQMGWPRPQGKGLMQERLTK